ncbi:MAG TPA: acetyl-CoA carboxylase biotin carboxylase subunit [Clostridiales bacterium]|nr:MAG: acetyl-CoA carboxylase biotin carboxylase subunit [Clostridiales bacterium GWD2_32_19]HCC06902.1 acetyl-CoA carboxylase biotin carboxylase subunit [Clostridiales bacterium]
MFKKILIANRGEIAIRIIRACREMGIETVAVYSKVDKDALHTQMADEAICIGEAASQDSYLNIQNILSATILSGAEAIHPGFGFLSENSRFARMCQECNIKFIGPKPEVIDKMGNKSKAREIMKQAGISVVPGSEGIVLDGYEALKLADKIGYPVMIKASAGGGGRGMRLARQREEFLKLFDTAQTEAKIGFGDPSMYVEKFIENPKHIEIQILADEHGNVIHLGERDCSIQRRHQKMIEEAPSVLLDEVLRKKMGETAVRAARTVKYQNAGTIEFLVDKNKNFYFMEMNTRIQVEHPITEMITGIDIVKEQILIATGKKLEIMQKDVKINGHAIECRINAEDPEHNFRPSPGKIENMHIPGGLGVRVDSAIYNGYTIPPNYDSMLTKLIVHAKTRTEAIAKMKRALSEFIVDGVKTNIDFHFQILNNEMFKNGTYDTGFIEHMKEGIR